MNVPYSLIFRDLSRYMCKSGEDGVLEQRANGRSGAGRKDKESDLAGE